MATHLAMQQADQRQGWSSLPSWGAPPLSCGGGNTWSKRLSAMADDDNDSWEVRAFAEDASSSGQWPPRSYACSFCRRGFRTAQALGGHMNVHRRERQEANKLRNAAAAAAAAAESHRLAAVVPNRDWDLASLSHLLGRQPTSRTTAELLSSLSPQSLSLSLSTSGSSMSSAVPSPESISSSSGIPADILCESLRQGRASWSSERGFHPYERSGLVSLARFSIVPKDNTPIMDLELRLGRSNSGDR